MTSFDSRIAWSNTTHEVKRALLVRQVLRLLGWRVRSRSRADCGLCQADHSRHGTVAFNERLWNCHRCQQGGSIFDLIMQVHQCTFFDALKFLANEARVELPERGKLSAAEQARLDREREEREQRERELDEACAEFEQRERELRKQCCQRIHEAERTLCKPGPWFKQDWLRATAAFTLRESLLVEYSLLSFGQMDERLRYLISDDRERARMLATVRWAGGVMADDNHFVNTVTT